jgi:hypothetical protein
MALRNPFIVVAARSIYSHSELERYKALVSIVHSLLAFCIPEEVYSEARAAFSAAAL